MLPTLDYHCLSNDNVQLTSPATKSGIYLLLPANFAPSSLQNYSSIAYFYLYETTELRYFIEAC